MRQGILPPLPLLLRLALFELFFLTPLVFYGWATTFSMTKETFAEISCLILLCCWVWVLLNREKRISFLRTPLTLPILLFLFSLLFSLMRSGSLYISFLQLGVWGCFVFVYFLTLWATEEPKWICLFMIASVMAGFLAGGYSILQFYGIELPIWREISGRMRLFSTFGNPNYLAGYLAASVPLVLFFIFTGKKWRIFWFLVIGTLYTSLLITQTRGAWAALFCSSIFILILLLIYKGRKFFYVNIANIIILALITGTITAIFSFPNPLNLREWDVVKRGTSTLRFKSTASQRLLIWKVAGDLIKEKPILGWGVGTFGVHYPQVQGEVLSEKENKEYIPQANRSINAHNDYLQIWVETGVLGLLIFLWIIIRFYRRVFYVLRIHSSEHYFSSLLLIFLTGAMTSFLIHAMVSFPFHIIQNGIFFWLILALGIKTAQMDSGDTSSQKIRKAPWVIKSRIFQCLNGNKIKVFLRWIFLGLIITCALYLIFWRVRIFRSDLYVKQAELLLEKNFYSAAYSNLKEAVKIDPYNTHAFADLTRACSQLDLYEESIEAAQKAKNGWNTANIHNREAFAYLKKGKFNRARGALRRCIYLYPNFAPGYINYGYLNLLEAEKSLQEGNFEKTIKNLDDAYLYYTQGKIWQPEFSYPLRLSRAYFRVNKKQDNSEKWKTRELSPSFIFYSKDEYLVKMLPFLAESGKNFNINLLLFSEKTLSGFREEENSSLNIIIAHNGKPYQEENFSDLELEPGIPCIMTLTLDRGLPTGIYTVQAQFCIGERAIATSKQQLRISS